MSPRIRRGPTRKATGTIEVTEVPTQPQRTIRADRLATGMILVSHGGAGRTVRAVDSRLGRYMVRFKAGEATTISGASTPVVVRLA